MILCCDLPRGKFPYLVFNLVVFGHLVSSCVTQATLETRVCHSRVYFNSHPTPLLSFYLLLSTSPPAAFPSLPPQLTLSLPHVDAIAPSYQKGYNWLFTRCAPVPSITLNGSMARRGTSVSPESLARISPSRLPSCWGTIGLVCTHSRLNFSEPFLVVLFLVKCTRD
jgi:hypothetical protein